MTKRARPEARPARAGWSTRRPYSCSVNVVLGITRMGWTGSAGRGVIAAGHDVADQSRVRVACVWHCGIGHLGLEDRPLATERLHQIGDSRESQAQELAVLQARNRRLVDAAQALEPALGPAIAQSCTPELAPDATETIHLLRREWPAVLRVDDPHRDRKAVGGCRPLNHRSPEASRAPRVMQRTASRTNRRDFARVTCRMQVATFRDSVGLMMEERPA
jgi:hypothetical protein